MRIAPVLVAAALFSGAWAVPQSQMADGGASVPKIDAKHEKDIEADKKLGEEYSKQIAKEVKFSEDQAAIDRVTRIGEDLAKIANTQKVNVLWGDSRLSPFDYTFHVIKGDDVNAFSIPGGYIYVYEGLVNEVESDDELAGVLAHEIAHAAFRHIATMQHEQSKFNIVNIGAILAAIWSRSDATKILLPTQLLNIGMQSGWSVKAEEAADYGGLQYMLKSKYNPLGMLTFMERLAYRDRLSPQIAWGIFETHPPSEDRAQTLLKELNEHNVPLHRSLVSSSLRATSKIGDSGIELFFGPNKIHVFAGDDSQMRADRAVDRINAFCDSVPALYELEVRDSSLYGEGRRLFEIEETDAEAEKVSLRDAVAKANQAMKSALFDLSYRVWTTRPGLGDADPSPPPP
ncbi:MAG TPA: M48 family metalloprotease [Fimbriimonadaceae bacterium]|nr:M48 family metalloprotease [Fimbriimonadaceae bacterium]